MNRLCNAILFQENRRIPTLTFSRAHPAFPRTLRETRAMRLKMSHGKTWSLCKAVSLQRERFADLAQSNCVGRHRLFPRSGNSFVSVRIPCISPSTIFILSRTTCSSSASWRNCVPRGSQSADLRDVFDSVAAEMDECRSPLHSLQTIPRRSPFAVSRKCSQFLRHSQPRTDSDKRYC